MVVTDENILGKDLSGILPENAVFIDIETTGLSARNSYIYLIGIVFREKDAWHCRQWFIDKQSQEMEALLAFKDAVKEFDVLVHFNGTTFDIPFLNSCASQYHIDLMLSNKESVDLYRELIRFAPLLDMKKKRQKDYEERMGLFREDKYTGKELINIYNSYRENHDEKLLKLLLLHNKEDCTGMLTVASAMSLPIILKSQFWLESAQISTDSDMAVLYLKSQSGVSFPSTAVYKSNDLKIIIYDDRIQLTICQKDGRVQFFFEKYRDYYYLPLEDYAVHKSIGTYVDSSCRKKATKETAYQWVDTKALLDDNNKLNCFLKALFSRYLGV